MSIYEYDEKKHAEHLKNEGKIESRLEDIQNLHASLNLPITQIMDLLKIPENERIILFQHLNTPTT